MGLVLQVGEVKDMPRAPKGFPKCGNWAFGGDAEDEDVSGCADVMNMSCVIRYDIWIIFLAVIFLRLF